MTSRGLGCGWLRDGRRTETSPSIPRAILVSAVTVGAFFIVVALLTTTSGCAPTPTGGIKGIVTIAPAEPVATAGTSPAGKPYAAKLMITELGGQHLKRPARVKSGADGHFSVSLEAGTYVVEADGHQSPPTLKPMTVKVVADRYTDVQVQFDSGIR